MVPGGARRRAGLAGARALHLPTRPRRARRAAAERLDVDFGGPGLDEPDGDGQWYLHLFAPEQPDLNWADPEVAASSSSTLRFWVDRGVDGFRIDVAHALAKDPEPLASQADLDADTWARARTRTRTATRCTTSTASGAGCSTSTTRRAPPSREAWVPAHRRSRYLRPDELAQAFNFDLLEARLGRDDVRARSSTGPSRSPASRARSSTWVLSNHDVVRHATRYALPEGTDLNAWLPHDGAEPPPTTSAASAAPGPRPC